MADAGADVRRKELFETFEISSGDIDTSSVVCGGVAGEGKLRFSVLKDDALSDAGQKLGEQRGSVICIGSGNMDDPAVLTVIGKSFNGAGDVFHCGLLKKIL